GGPDATPASPVSAAVGAVIATVVAVLAYAIGFLSAGLGVLVLLSRYEEPDAAEAVTLSLSGAGIALFGLLVVAVAAGIRRGSGLSRLLVTVYLAIAVVLSTVIAITSDRWDGGASAVGLVAVVTIVLLWTPPVSRRFGRIRDSSMTARPAEASPPTAR
ncbi:MAG: cation-translocating P-type ATPase, partial [Microbacterium sp.]|nr:cation-translocating P-type ATPase [Microbacterium sp.]